MTTTETPPASTEPVQEPAAKTNGAPSVTRLGAEEAKRTFPPRRRLGDDQEREVTRLYVETTTPVAQIGQQFGIGESSVYRIAQRNGAALRGRQPTSAPATDGVATADATPPAPSSPAPVAEAPESVAAPVAPPPPAPVAKAARKPRAKAAPAAPVAPVAPVAATPAAKPGRGRRAATPAPAPVASPPAAVQPVAAVAKPTASPVKARAARTPRAKATPAAAPAVAPVRGAQLRFRIRFHAETVIEAADIRAALRQLDSLGATDVQAITREA